MTTAMSKRNQARNERALQDLLKTVPGNERCADCSARNPGWASWSLGIFICMRCAAIHRKLGTHISKVKSLSMDSWTNDQVEVMKKTGNVNSNQLYNPKGKAPIVPIDQDEMDGAVEWFIRQKYVEKAFQEGASSTRVQQIHRNQTFGETEPRRENVLQSSREPSFGDDETAASAPAKSGKKFGFGLRSASSTFNLGRKSRERKSSLPAGKVVGATIGLKEEGLEWKLVTLKEMGFPDEKRNTEILRGLNGDLERAIESLVRLGQGPPKPGLAKKVSTTFASTASLPERAQKTPTFAPANGGGFGASLHQSPQSTGLSASQSSASSPGFRKTSNNPFDAASPQAAQSSQTNIDQAFGNMTISQPMSSQSTGILPSQQSSQLPIYQQAMTPPPLSNSLQAYGFNPFMQQQQQQHYALQIQPTGPNPFMQQQIPQNSVMNQQNPYAAHPIQPQQTGNPFLQQQSQPQTPTSNPFFQHQQNNVNTHASNAFYQQQSDFASQQSWTQSPASQRTPQNGVYGAHQQSAQDPYQQGFQYQQQSRIQASQQQFQPQQIQSPQTNGQFKPFLQTQPQLLQSHQQQQTQPQVQSQPQQQFQPNQFGQPQPLVAQSTGRMNKQSILALYSMQPSIPEHPEQPQVPQRSATMPATMSTGSNNPFGAAANDGAVASTQGNAKNRDSIFAGRDDPFASLSSKIR